MINVFIEKRLSKHSHFLCLQLKKLWCREVKKISCPKQHEFVNGEEAVILASDVASQVPETLGRQRMSYIQLQEWCEPRREQVVLVKKAVLYLHLCRNSLNKAISKSILHYK